MRHLVVVIVGVVMAAAVINFGPPLNGQDCGPAWRIFSSPDFGSGNNELYGIDAVAATDIWAVGRYSDADGYKTLSLHWDGNAWMVVPTPNVGSAFNQMYSIAALSADNAWSVGASSDQNLVYQPLITHWDGTQWSVVPAAIAPGSAAFLYGIAAIAPNDIWAVGYIQVGFSAQQPLAMHWDGMSWNLVPTPSTSPANRDILWGITALAGNDVWATGSSTDAVTGEYHTFIQHWNGSAWSIISSPNPNGSIYNFIWGIEAVSANDIWIMGRAYDGNSYPSLVERWDGSAWSITASPSERFYNELYDAAALSPSDVWAVGRYGGGFDNNVAMVMHWNGSVWAVVANPDPPGATENNFLYSVTAVSSGDVWAVGSYFKENKFQTLIERYSNIPCLTPSSVVSRKTHGNSGTFDVDLPLTGNPGIECRSGGTNGDYTLVFRFANTLASVGGASFTSGSGSVDSRSVDTTDRRNYIVNLTGVTNAQSITVSLTNVADSVGNFSKAVSATMGVLLGDVTGNRVVTNTDVGAVKAQVDPTTAVTIGNFRDDVTANGFVTNTDVGMVKAHVNPTGGLNSPP